MKSTPAIYPCRYRTDIPHPTVSLCFQVLLPDFLQGERNSGIPLRILGDSFSDSMPDAAGLLSCWYLTNRITGQMRTFSFRSFLWLSRLKTIRFSGSQAHKLIWFLKEFIHGTAIWAGPENQQETPERAEGRKQVRRDMQNGRQLFQVYSEGTCSWRCGTRADTDVFRRRLCFRAQFRFRGNSGGVREKNLCHGCLCPVSRIWCRYWNAEHQLPHRSFPYLLGRMVSK